MKTETRRVAVFIAAGMVAAAAIGFAVWRAGTPAVPYVSDTATPTPVVSTIATTSHDAVSDEADIDQNPPVIPTAEDPFLPPNAVLQPEPSAANPTTVYRPDNIFRTPGSGQDTGQREPTPAPAPRPSPSPPPATPTTTTATPTTPTTTGTTTPTTQTPAQAPAQATPATPTGTDAPMTSPTGLGGTAPLPTEALTPEPTAEPEPSAEPTPEPPEADQPTSEQPAEPEPGDEPEDVEYGAGLLSVG